MTKQLKPGQGVEAGRICAGCPTRLSRYNRDRYCYACSRRRQELFDRIAAVVWEADEAAGRVEGMAHSAAFERARIYADALHEVMLLLRDTDGTLAGGIHSLKRDTGMSEDKIKRALGILRSDGRIEFLEYSYGRKGRGKKTIWRIGDA